MSDEKGHRNQYYEPPGLGGSARLAAALVAAALALAACGSDERSFSAEEFIEEANAHGANLALGQPLSTSEADAELYAVTIEEPQAGSGPGPAIGHEHGGGSLRVTESVEDAEAEVGRCEQAVSLFCYRAANVVLIFEQDAEPQALADVAAALRALEE